MKKSMWKTWKFKWIYSMQSHSSILSHILWAHLSCHGLSVTCTDTSLCYVSYQTWGNLRTWIRNGLITLKKCQVPARTRGYTWNLSHHLPPHRSVTTPYATPMDGEETKLFQREEKRRVSAFFSLWLDVRFIGFCARKGGKMRKSHNH